MKFLRTASTRRLLAALAGLVAAIAVGTAIAVAASSGGSKPPKMPLADAIHQALAAPAIESVSADITFTNSLISSSSIEGSDPILTGAHGRLWASSDHRLRLELQASNGSGQDAEVVLDNGSFWVYDPMSNTVYKGTLPSHTGASQKQSQTHEQMPTVAQIQSQLGQLMTHLNLSEAIPSNVAGEPAYTVTVSPKHDGGLLGAVQLAWDAARGVPLRFALYAKDRSTPVLELTATDISFNTPVKPSDFQVSPPAGAKVVQVSTPPVGNGTSGQPAETKGKNAHQEITGVSAVAKHLSFPLAAPASLDGLPRQSVRLLDWGGRPAALVTYGQNLGGIAVIEQTASGQSATPGASSAPGSGDHHGLSLPTVSINGSTAQELDTAIGTVLRFTRGGVAYTVLGSVPPIAAEAAARAL
jgi:outer membrane lipoprotein-sorting protein